MAKAPYREYKQIAAYARYEIDGKTVLYVSPGWLDFRPKVGDKVTYVAAMNDSPGIHDLDILVDRSIMVVDKIEQFKGGHYITVSVDIDHMPTTRKQVDGFIRNNY